MDARTIPAENRTFGGRFRITQLLKQGHGVATWLATDLQENSPLVVKTAAVADVPRSVRQRLEHEALVLQQMHNPCLAPLLRYGFDEGLLFLCLPLVPGVILEQRLRHGPLGVRDTLTVGSCLFEALHEAHERAVLHRDVKPANIIVEEVGPIRKAVLIDFGLARSAQLEASIRDLPVGTVRYLAPEQAGLLERGVDARSDLYSVGAVLFECLAGRPPFLGETAGEVLRQHLAAPAPELRSLGIAAPRALDEFVQRLLCKDPRDRYQSAGAALADLTTIAAALDRGVTEPGLVVGASDRRATLTDPAFIGRTADIEALEEALAQARRGSGGLVLIEAPSGGGKTWLLNELAQRSLAHGVWVQRGRGVDQMAQRPFQVLAGVVAELTDAARSDPALGQLLRERLGDQRDVAAAVLPELAGPLEVKTGGSLGPEAFAEARSLPALATLLDALGTAARPAAVLLDDCQWADELTLKLLHYWSHAPGPNGAGKRHTLLVAVFRSEEVPPEHPLRRLQPAAHLVLSAFSPAEVADLVSSMAGPVPAEATAVVTRLAEGSPFMAAAMLRGLVESGALVAAETGWLVEPLALADVQSSRHAAALLARRLGLLPAPVRELLSVGAVLGKEFDLDLATVLAGQPPHQAILTLEEARRRHIIWADKQGARWVFVHDKLREALLDRLPPAERRRLHRRAAEQLEHLDAGRVFELAYHFDAADEGARALPYAVAAAERARAQQSLAIAERQYRIAERGAAGAEPALRRRVAEGLGEVLMLRGGYDEAGRKLAEARTLADSDVTRAQLEGKLGELAFKQGEVQQASEAIERGLKLLGRWVPRTTLGLLPALAWEVVVQVVHTVLPFVRGRRRLEGAETERLAMRLYSRLAYANWFKRGALACLWAHLREMNLAERYPPTPELAQAYSEHAPAMTILPYFRRGRVYVERSLAIRRALGDVWGQGQSLSFFGLVLYAASRYAECIEKCQAAIRLLERTGDRWEVNTARWHIAYALYRLGDLRGAVEVAQAAYRAGQEIGDHHAMGISLAAWAKASGGQVPEKLLRAEVEHAVDDLHMRAELAQAEAVRLLSLGRPMAAVAALEEARRVTRGMRQEYVAPLLPWLATALRRELEQMPVWDPRRRRARLRYARRVARRALRLARAFQNNLPHALREAALLAAMAGRTRQARKQLCASLAVAQRQGARYEHAQTLREQGEVGLTLGWPNAAHDLEAGREALRIIEPGPAETPLEPAKPFTLSLADRFETLLDTGRQIALALTPAAVFTAVRETALRLLRAERCVVLVVKPDTEPPEFTALGDGPDAAYSLTLARQSLAAGRPVLFTEGLSGDPSESMALSGVRSALCAPVGVHGRAVACFAVTHRHVGQLFGETEERLAAFIAAVAGAALEKAEGFAQVEALSQARLQLLERERATRAELEILTLKLRDQQKWLEGVLDLLPVPLLLIEPGTARVTFANRPADDMAGGEFPRSRPAAEYYTAYHCTDAAGQTIPGTDMPEVRLARGERLDGCEMRWHTPAGPRDLIIYGDTLPAMHGQPATGVVLFQDISRLKEVEAELRRSNQAKDEFLAMLAHELRNPLAPIFNSLYLLRAAGHDTAMSEQARSVLERQVRHIARLVDDLLDATRIARGKIQLHSEPLDLARLVRTTGEDRRPMLEAAGLVLELEVPEGPVWVVGDATRLAQVVNNLLDNAAKFTDPGGRVTVQLRGAAEPPQAVLRVRDTGIGVEPEMLPALFGIFTQADRSLDRSRGGLGLGLALVKGLVELHGGRVEAFSAGLGQGAEFVIRLPSEAAM